MIRCSCSCGFVFAAPEAHAGRAFPCQGCGKRIQLACAEPLPEGAGEGDFDARLIITAGPDRIGQEILLGGVSEIRIGKNADNTICLAAALVSRMHCRLERIDFGPSRWRLIDNNSTNGLFVNEQRITSVELRDGDAVAIGGYGLRYRCPPTYAAAAVAASSVAASAYSAVASTAPAVAQPVIAGSVAEAGGRCPSCGRPLQANTRICTDCGIYIDTGRPVIISKGFDEEEMEQRCGTLIKSISWIPPFFGLLPITSEAFGTRRPTATWAILAITALVTLGFYPALRSADGLSTAMAPFELWAGSRPAAHEALVEVRGALKQVRDAIEMLPGIVDETDLPPRMQAKVADLHRAEKALMFHVEHGRMQYHQFLTHAFLHAGILHLVGNMVFLLVFGLRVNEIIGSTRTAIIYPLLAVAAAASHFYVSRYQPLHPMIGASGAVMGLAGMYFVLCPVQRVRMAVWVWLGPLAGFMTLYKIFRIRGFWLLLIWIAWNDVLPATISLMAGRPIDSVAHFAHLGGFATGALAALLLLVTRSTSAHGGDLLSVALGKHAWPLIGKPVVRIAPAAPATTAV